MASRTQRVQEASKWRGAAELVEVSGRRMTAADWAEVFDLSREMTRRAAVDGAVRACQMAPEMMALLADCARGDKTFKGAPAAVRRAAIMDLLDMATGGPEGRRELMGAGTKQPELKDLPNSSELRAFIEAGNAALAAARAKASAADAVVIDSQPPAQPATDGPTASS